MNACRAVPKGLPLHRLQSRPVVSQQQLMMAVGDEPASVAGRPVPSSRWFHGRRSHLLYVVHFLGAGTVWCRVGRDMGSNQCSAF